MSRSLLVGWFSSVYRVLLYAYPPDFRRRYGREMAQVFSDRCREIAQARGLPGLVVFGANSGVDWLTSAIREGLADMSTADHLAPVAAGTPGDAPVFYMCGSSLPARSAFINGAGLSLALFIGLYFAMSHGAGHLRLPALLIGSHRPHPNLLEARTPAAASTELDTQVTVETESNSPVNWYVTLYFRVMLVLGSLDANHDFVISSAEIADAPAALRKLDVNFDGQLNTEECGQGFGNNFTNSDASEFMQNSARLKRARLVFMRIHPVLAALDSDHDGEISASEIRNAAAALKTLDKNRDGSLTPNEVLPDPVDNAVAHVFSWLDTNGDGLISTPERANPRAAGLPELLEAADRNKDGFITEEELTKEIRLRALLHGIKTNEQILIGLVSGLQSGGEDLPVARRAKTEVPNASGRK